MKITQSIYKKSGRMSSSTVFKRTNCGTILKGELVEQVIKEPFLKKLFHQNLPSHITPLEENPECLIVLGQAILKYAKQVCEEKKQVKIIRTIQIEVTDLPQEKAIEKQINGLGGSMVRIANGNTLTVRLKNQLATSKIRRFFAEREELGALSDKIDTPIEQEIGNFLYKKEMTSPRSSLEVSPAESAATTSSSSKAARAMGRKRKAEEENNEKRGPKRRPAAPPPSLSPSPANASPPAAAPPPSLSPSPANTSPPAAAPTPSLSPSSANTYPPATPTLSTPTQTKPAETTLPSTLPSEAARTLGSKRKADEESNVIRRQKRRATAETPTPSLSPPSASSSSSRVPVNSSTPSVPHLRLTKSAPWDEIWKQGPGVEVKRQAIQQIVTRAGKSMSGNQERIQRLIRNVEQKIFTNAKSRDEYITGSEGLMKALSEAKMAEYRVQRSSAHPQPSPLNTDQSAPPSEGNELTTEALIARLWAKEVTRSMAEKKGAERESEKREKIGRRKKVNA